jgi:hypothetical protein
MQRCQAVRERERQHRCTLHAGRSTRFVRLKPAHHSSQRAHPTWVASSPSLVGWGKWIPILTTPALCAHEGGQNEGGGGHFSSIAQRCGPAHALTTASDPTWVASSLSLVGRGTWIPILTTPALCTHEGGQHGSGAGISVLRCGRVDSALCAAPSPPRRALARRLGESATCELGGARCHRSGELAAGPGLGALGPGAVVIAGGLL